MLSLPCATARAQDAKAYLSTVFIEGVPFDVARSMGQQYVREFADVLRDRSAAAQATWGNAVVAIGAGGGAGSEAILIDFFTRLPSDKPLSPEVCRAAFAVPVALAYHINQSRSVSALDFLTGLAERKPGVRWTCEYHSSADEVARDLQQLALPALGLAGTAESGARLKSLEPKLQDVGSRAALARARAVHADVVQYGLSEHYRRALAGRAKKK
jgi:hypothetical protein